MGIIAAGVFLYPVLFPSKEASPQEIESLLWKKEYRQAYELAPDERKSEIVAENVTLQVADRYNFKHLYITTTSIIKEIYYDEETAYLVLKVAPTDILEGDLTGYYFYTYNKDKGAFEYIEGVRTLEYEEPDYSDDNFDESEWKKDNK